MDEKSGTVIDLAQVSAVVCTMNSIASIEMCLRSVRDAGVGEIVVVDARSTDGTREVADHLANIVVEDEGIGLGNARNQGIARTTGLYVLNLGSDNIVDRSALEMMVRQLIDGGHHGVSAQTIVAGHDYVSASMAAWRRARFRPGPSAVIGTPTLFRGPQLRADPFDVTRQHSDDAELCERWRARYGATFAISEAVVVESGKTTWSEIRQRCRNYGFSDHEVFAAGRRSGWSIRRQVISLLHPMRCDFLAPVTRLGVREGVIRAPFLAAITGLRYASWADVAIHRPPTATD